MKKTTPLLLGTAFLLVGCARTAEATLATEDAELPTAAETFHPEETSEPTRTNIPATDTMTATEALTESIGTETIDPTETLIPTNTQIPSTSTATATAGRITMLSNGVGVIAFHSKRTGNGDIYIMGSDGSNPTRITTHSALDHWPSWSPDGSQIAFTSVRDGNSNIYVVDVDGTNRRRLTSDAAPDWEPAWSIIRIDHGLHKNGRKTIQTV